MFEAPKAVNRSHNSEKWTDQERIDAFAESGNPDYLTPEIAHRLGLGSNFMVKVRGANTEDIEVAQQRQEQFQNESKASQQTRLGRFSLDDEALKKIQESGSIAFIQHLLSVACLEVNNPNIDIENDAEEAEHLAKDIIYDYVLKNETGMDDLFDSIRLNGVEGLRDVQILSDVFKKLYNRFITLMNNADLSQEELIEGQVVSERLGRGAQIAESFVKRDVDGDFVKQGIGGDFNYLAYYRLLTFCDWRRFTEPSNVSTDELELADSLIGLERVADFDQDEIIPFEIERGKFAVFAVGKHALYVADKELSQSLFETISEAKEQIKYSVAGQHFARHYVAEVPNELLESAIIIEDQGTRLRTGALEGLFEGPNQLRDYLYLLRADMRRLLEEHFSIELKDLSIREQVYFLTYLQHTTVKQSNSVRVFNETYGVDGMRTFLSLERAGAELGDLIIEFGRDSSIAPKIFRYYSELLSSADRAEALVHQVSNCEGDICTELANQVRENILNRAQKDLEKAVRAHDPSEVAAQIENYVAEAKEYVALLQEVGAGKIESVSPESLSDEDRSRMQDLLQANYRKAYPEPENDDFKAAVAGSLTKSFSNPHTTFRILRDNGKIVGYNRFDTLRDYTGKEVSYFGSFNADPAYSGVGGIMLEATIKERLVDGRPMMAHCDPTQAVTRKYIEDGFVATAHYSLAGKPSFEIWRSQDLGTKLESKNKSIEGLLDITEGLGTIVVREQSVTEEYPELKAGKALTRYFTHERKTYLVFETLPSSLREAFTPPQEEQKKAV